MKEQTEINRGYIDHLRNLNRSAIGDAGGAYSPSLPRLKELISLWWSQAPTILGLIAVACLLQVWLRLYLLVKRSKLSQLNKLAIDNVHRFVEQYPFHLYPVVCKAFELACLADEIPQLLQQNTSILEVAIGDGTLSSRAFPPEANVVGLDLSPYSLKKASAKPHVKQAIVCDCLTPPIREGSFDVLIANNFLHHVTHKEQTLSRWSRIAEKALFNENSPYWTSGWPVPYMLKKLGKKKKASRLVDLIERRGLQCLEPKELLDAHVIKNYEIIQCASYMSERTFFYCGIFSYIMRCYGPPTPPRLKALFLTKLRWLVLPLTANLAKLLIRYDQHQDRSTDAFISYACKSRIYAPLSSGNCLICPDCKGELARSNQCQECGREYSYTDGMLFLLPKELEDLQREYNYEVSAQISKEHL